jgi:eukaryotic-like serine/threonine-protein kinase
MEELEKKTPEARADGPDSDAHAETAKVEPAQATTLPMATGGETLARGTAIGRYVVLDPIGAGAMGVVYAAYDRNLDRRIALKLVRDPGRGSTRRRFLREAKALAQLSHPHVVAAFDIGEFRDQLFLAMELVPGQNLRDWLAGTSRGRREVVEVYRRAGEGLAAAHAAGVVHRDFKPENCLIDERGRVRVADFGLALMAGAVADEESDAGEEPASARLTSTGAVVGTPAYMAPEQRSGCMPVDARADQFSFAVSLYEALCGERPFEPEGAAGVRASASPFAGERAAARMGEPGVDAARDLPARIRRVLSRALATDPDERYPSMDALLADLRRDPARRRRIALASAGGAVVAAAALLVATSGNEGSPCQGGAEKLAGVWDPVRKQAVRSAFRASGSSQADDAWARVEPALDRWSADWTAMRTDACEATHVRREQSASLLDLRMECLDGRLSDLSALVDLLSTGADASTVEHAAQAAESLAPAARCADGKALSGELRPPPEESTRIAELRDRLARVKALTTTGKYEEALAPGRQLAADAAAIGYRPLEAEALAYVAETERQRGNLDASEDALYRQIEAAQAGRATRLAAEGLIILTWLVGVHDERWQEGDRLARLARAALDAMSRDDEMEALYESTVGSLRIEQGKLAEARPHLERALALAEKVFGPEGAYVGEPVHLLANLAEKEGRYDEAISLHRRARALAEAALGTEHPDVISMLSTEAVALDAAGRVEEALALNRRALALAERVIGPTSEQGATILTNIAVALEGREQHAEALAHLERALAAYDQIRGPDHFVSADVYSNMGDSLRGLKRWGEAAEKYRHAAAIYQETGGPDHPGVARCTGAIGQTWLEAGQPARAIEPLERSIAMFDRIGTRAGPAAGTRYFLARALWSTGRDRARARSLLVDALARFQVERDVEAVVEVAGWLTRIR